MRPGILLTTKMGDKINSMVIGWGTLGIVWERPIFVAYVRDCRYTKQMLDHCQEFTVNVPTGPFDKRVLGICGGMSGREMDKIALSGLTPVEPEIISTPGLKEFPLTLECKVLYDQEQEASLLGMDIKKSFYTIEKGDHTAYYGHVVSSYIIED